MRMVESSNGCNICRRIPAPTKDEIGWIMSGQPLASLILEAYNKTHPDSATTNVDGTIGSMNSVMDNLEALFGFAQDDGTVPIEKEDLHKEFIFYKNGDHTIIRLPIGHTPISFCPFCGRPFAKNT